MINRYLKNQLKLQEADIQGRPWILDSGWKSKIIINGIKKSKLESWYLDKYIKQILCFLREFEDFCISYVYRESNRVADKLENLGKNNLHGHQNDIFEDFGLLKLA